MRSLKTIIGAGVALLFAAFALIFQGSVFEGVHGVRAFFGRITDTEFSYEGLALLRTEVEALRAEREIFIEAGIPPFSADLRKIPVYSRYPYGAEGLLMIAGGENEGVKEGAPVLATPGTLLGRVTRVERFRSEVMTIFNPEWRSSVGLGRTGTKALLEGGESPLLTLIPRGKEPVARTEIINIDPSFPFGLFLGINGEVKENATDPWREAPLEAAYQEADLLDVLVLVNFP